MANKKINQLVLKTTIQPTDLFPLGDATTGQLFKKTVAELQAAIGGAVISVNGLVGTVVLDTDDIQELASPTNRYFTEARARAAISLTTTGSSGASTYSSSTGVLNVPTYTLAGLGGITASFLSGGTGITYNSGTGVISYSGTVYTDASIRALISLTTSGSSGASTYNNTTGVLNVPTYTLAGLGGISLSSLSGSAPITYNSSTGAIGITQASGSTNGFLSSTDWNTFNNKQGTITLTTTGNSGAATLVGSTLNIPQYQGVLTNPVTGTGTTNTLPKWTSSSALGNSNITDTGSLITLGSNTTISSGGSLGIGGLSFTGSAGGNLFIGKAISGNINSNGVGLNATIQSDVTGVSVGYLSSLSTQAATFTINQIRHFQASQSTFGAGSTVDNQYGFWTSGLTGATNNYGFFGNIASGTNRWNLYMNGTANNYMAGSLGIGTTALTDTNFKIQKNISGNTLAFGIYQNSVVQSDVTSQANYNATFVSTQAASFTLTDLRHYYAQQGTLGAGSSVTNQYGFIVQNNLTGATNNFGFYGNIAAGTGRWNLYMNGTANNYLAGNLGIGTSAPSAKLHVVGTTRINSTSDASQYMELYTASGISYYHSQNNSAFYTAFQHIFNTDGTSATERMRITSAGNVGIGTSSPAYTLDVNGDSRLLVAASGTRNLFFGTSATNYGKITYNDTSGELSLGTTQGYSTVFLTNNTEKMRITSGGDILVSNASLSNGAGSRAMSIYGSSGSGGTDISSISLFQIWNGNAYPAIVSAQQDSAYGNASSILVFKTSFFSGGINTAERMRITATGNLLLGTTTDNGERLYVSGSIRATGSITANSDVRLKKNIERIENALQKVSEISGYTYNTIYDEERHAGVIAQEIDKVLPEIVNKGNDGLMGVEYGNISALLIEAIKEQKILIDNLQAKVEALSK
jgi:hypothetical protein